MKTSYYWTLVFALTGAIILGKSFPVANSIPNKKSLETKIIEVLPKKLDKIEHPFLYSQEELDRFDNWIDSTLVESARNGSNSIIVNKKTKLLYLIKNGKVDSEYNIELGYNLDLKYSPYEDKQKEGDYCTPEGKYNIKAKFNSKELYKAILINYPNEEDKAKGKTGSLIEIHGGGGKGYDWTFGCVALSNSDMEKIFPYLNKGDRITIVRCTSRYLSP